MEENKRKPNVRIVNVDGIDYVMHTIHRGNRTYKKFYNVEYS